MQGGRPADLDGLGGGGGAGAQQAQAERERQKRLHGAPPRGRTAQSFTPNQSAAQAPGWGSVQRPVLPNPPSPRAVIDENASTISKDAWNTGTNSICMIRSPGAMVSGSSPLLNSTRPTSPW